VVSLNVTYFQKKIRCMCSHWLFGIYSSNNHSFGTLNAKRYDSSSRNHKLRVKIDVHTNLYVCAKN
jgi:hypothetical protein